LLIAFALVLLAVELRWGPVHRLDQRVAVDLHRAAVDHPAAVSWWTWVSRVLHPDVERVAGAVAAIGLWFAHRRGTAVFVVVALAGQAALEAITKTLVGRRRPMFAGPVAHASGAAFPSGHAMTSILAFGLLVLLVPRGAKPAAAVGGAVAVVLVGFSRLALGVHFVTDVIAGWLLGAAWLVAADWLRQRGVFSRPSPRAAAPRARDRPRGTPAC
jgi:membrane-associated phospholipid phosphatase